MFRFLENPGCSRKSRNLIKTVILVHLRAQAVILGILQAHPVNLGKGDKKIVRYEYEIPSINSAEVKYHPPVIHIHIDKVYIHRWTMWL